MEPTWSPNGSQIEPNEDEILAKTEVEWVWNSFGIRRKSMGNSYGISLELVGKSEGLFGNVLGMHRGCRGMSVESIGNYYVFFGNSWYS